MLKVINLFAGPGAGKSTTAAALFNLMKRERFEVELVTEVAKDLTYEQAFGRLGDQVYILAEQNHRLERLRGQVEWAITDSPLPLGMVYMDRERTAQEVVLGLAMTITGLWNTYENYSFLLSRTKRAYQTYGRNQTLEEAVAKDKQIKDMLDMVDCPYHEIDPDDPTVEYKMLATLKGRK